MYFQKEWLYLHLDQQEKFLQYQEIPLFGPHNLENIMAATLVGLSFGLSPSQIKNSILTFQGLEHRLEKVTSIAGVTFFNDSKATNIDATLKSIQSFDQDLIIILGGRDKGGDFKQLIPAIKKRVKAAVLLGEAKEKIHAALQGIIPLYPVSSLTQAVETSYSLASPGDIVLLAPACTSFDMFKNFEERGQKFKEEVLSLKNRLRPK
jgi:UDP-N-acetylmuramoylalanine--D-glutamate ligase